MTTFDTTTQFNTFENRRNLSLSMKLFTIRGAYGYKGFTEKVGENLYKSNTLTFQDAIENATKPLDASKVSALSANQLTVLNQTASGRSLIPLLSRMGELGMMDLRQGLVNPEFANSFQNSQYTTAISAYQRSI